MNTNEPLDLLGLKPTKLAELAKNTANTIAQKDRLKTHQLRNVFSAIEKMRTLHKRILKLKDKDEEEQMRSDLEMQLVMLKPKIAYAAGRQRSVRYTFFPFVESAVDAVEEAKYSDKAFQRFFMLMESVVAYHKFYEK